MIAKGNDVLAYQVKFWKEQIKPTLTEALKRSPQGKLDWAPAPGMISLGMIFLHISECSDWWYDEVMKKIPAIPLGRRQIGASDPQPPCGGTYDSRHNQDAQSLNDAHKRSRFYRRRIGS